MVGVHATSGPQNKYQQKIAPISPNSMMQQSKKQAKNSRKKARSSERQKKTLEKKKSDKTKSDITTGGAMVGKQGGANAGSKKSS